MSLRTLFAMLVVLVVTRPVAGAIVSGVAAARLRAAAFAGLRIHRLSQTSRVA